MKSIDLMRNKDEILDTILKMAIEQERIDSHVVARSLNVKVATAVALLQRLGQRGYLVPIRDKELCRAVWKPTEWVRINEIQEYKSTVLPGCKRYFVDPVAATQFASSPDLQEKFGAETPAEAKARFRSHLRSVNRSGRRGYASKSA